MAALLSFSLTIRAHSRVLLDLCCMTTTTPEAERSGDPGAMIGLLGLIVAGVWVVGSLAGAVVLIGPEKIGSLTIPEFGAVGAVTVLPALMAVFSGLAARDSARLVALKAQQGAASELERLDAERTLLAARCT